METSNLELFLNLNNLSEQERKQLVTLIEKSSVKQNCYGKSLIGRKVNAGTRFKVINIEPHKINGFNYRCVDEYLGKIGKFNSTFTFIEDAFVCTATFEEDYIDAIDKKNGNFCWRFDEIELLND